MKTLASTVVELIETDDVTKDYTSQVEKIVKGCTEQELDKINTIFTHLTGYTLTTIINQVKEEKENE